ncbi:hypothetical protein [Nocardioides perillae]|uniref:Uncharacterized protein n=1 Tax=Nocardioides perillae TaxID=1119534 RepID=A0A7Y9RS56_9ACTN|nr:hypothetical protein [Nocardioides perillae]NYG54286.1 hypothetical protein [Nocardioides perillae]
MPTHALPDPTHGAVLLDPRGGGRALRATWHLDRTDESGRADPLVVLSLWRDNVCAGSFRLTPAEVPGLVALLAGGLDALERRSGPVRTDATTGGPASDAGHAAAG